MKVETERDDFSNEKKVERLKKLIIMYWISLFLQAKYN